MNSLDRLGEIAVRLGRLTSEADGLYIERRRIWQAELDAGRSPIELAERSGVKPVTVRQLVARAGRK